jgi:2-amino-4-hydroxy-6-hydroxymethyldihydropteridine diphosphokinase
VTRAVLSIGSNLGDRYKHLRDAVAAFGETLLLTSGVYETPPWGDADQPAYLNAVLMVADPAAAAGDWLERAQAAENAAGRVRDPGRRFGPRTLDVDVIAVWDADGRPVLSDDAELTLPHPRAHQRAFVLRPWIDIDPFGVLPGHGTLSELLTGAALAGDVAAMTARPELPLESTG